MTNFKELGFKDKMLFDFEFHFDPGLRAKGGNYISLTWARSDEEDWCLILDKKVRK